MQKQHAIAIYNASAGSGKTFALVSNYLSILLKSNSSFKFRHILAITFTNKAVSEMKSRIVINLKDFAYGKNQQESAMFTAVKERTGLEAQSIRERAALVLQNIVQDYASFDVVTIDNFTHRIIRSFARDLKIPQNFEVELDTNQVLELAVDNLIAKAGSDNQLTPILINYTIEKIDDDKSWDISRDFNDIARLLLSENDRYYIKLLKDRSLDDFSALHKHILQQNKKYSKAIKKDAADLLAYLNVQGLEPNHFYKKLVPNALQKFESGDFTYNPDSKWVKFMGEEAFYTKTQKAAIKAIIDAIAGEITGRFKEITSTINKLQLNEELLRKITPLSLLKAIDLEVQKIKNEQNLLLISDFNEVINKNIANQPTPFIYERLGERYQHYFIDEFQDTSILQWQNLIPLIDNAVSAQSQEEPDNSLMLVGDPKQAIYRWRGGYAEQFIALSAGKNPFQNQDFNPVNLEYNYRSHEEIINFNNSFFTHTADYLEHPAYAAIYEKGNSQKINHRTGGCVTLSFIEAETREEAEILYLDKTLDLVNQSLERGFSKSEICLIVRKNDEGILLAKHLQENNIPVISSQSLLLSQSKEVRFIIDVLSFAQQPEAQELSIALLEYLAENYLDLDHPHIFYVQMLPLQGQKLFNALPGGHFFRLNHCQRLPLYEAVEYIIQCFKLNEEAGAYLQSFLDAVHDFTQKNNSGIQGFLQWWEKNAGSLSISTPAHIDAIQIMTIHKAKGLEFPVVIYPFAETPLYPSNDVMNWYPTSPEHYLGFEALLIAQKKSLLHLSEDTSAIYYAKRQQQQLDNLNMLYVVLTRAVEQLHLVSRFGKKSKPTGDPKNFAELLINDLDKRNLWENTKTSYMFGSPLRQSRPPVETRTGESLQLPSSPKEVNNLLIVTRAERLWDEHRLQSIHTGRLLHEILAKVNLDTDIEPVLHEAKQLGHLTEALLEDTRKQLKQLVEDLYREGFFQPTNTIFTERELVHEGQFLRPDRVEIDGEGQALLLDYKTGAPDNSHEDQIQNYARALQNAGYKVVKKILVYINENQSIQAV